MRKDAPLAVEVPAPGHDGPAWVKVGVIAAVGFVIGVAWPRVMGVKLGPNAPGEAAAAAAASASAAAASGKHEGAPPASVTARSSASAIASTAPAAAPPGGAPQVSVLRGNVISCKTSDGESKKGRECGTVTGLDNVVAPHLRKLATCSAAEGQTGKLSFLASVEFPSGRLTWDIGRSSTVGNLEGITGCLKTHFSGVTANNVAHEHARYTVGYNVTLAPGADAVPAKVADKDDVVKGDMPAPEKNAKDEREGKPDLASGEASVGWEVALVRDVPKTGAVVARLPRGTKVKVGASKDGWYAIKYGDAFASDGFVYRGALNR
ncbi:MAG: hypothetical protein JWP97_6335 [Labilithrix sp.]|nr:hypothetical protein [Labilithrix sp.]